MKTSLASALLAMFGNRRRFGFAHDVFEKLGCDVSWIGIEISSKIA